MDSPSSNGAQCMVMTKNTFLHVRSMNGPVLRKSCTEPTLEREEQQDEMRHSLPDIFSIVEASKGRGRSLSSYTTVAPRLAEDCSSVSSLEAHTAIMIRHIPCKYTQQHLLEEIRQYTEGFDFLYLPPARTSKTQKNLGYA